MKKRILFIVPDGTGIKNYLFSDILKYLNSSEIELIICHSLPEEAIKEVENLHEVKLVQKKLSSYVETIKQKFYRESICYARLLYNSRLVDNDTIMTNWNTNKKGVQKIFYKFVEQYGRILSTSYKKILKAEAKYQQLLLSSIENQESLLKEINPDVIFCTHQRSLKAVPIIRAAKTLGIKSVGAIYSWDNLPKARLAVRTDDYIVWSNYMKEELKLYYPEIDEKNIIITGTPQFEFYEKQENYLDKKDFFNKYNIDDNKITICFSGDDEMTSPFDPNYLRDISTELLKSGGADRFQILFRRSPVDISGRYDSVINEFSDLIKPISPYWSNDKKDWTSLYPFYEDIYLLSSICKYSDLVINLGSTMAHDFACLKKPAIYLNYNTVNSNNWSVETIYSFQHFRSMKSDKSVFWINNEKEIISIIEKALLGIPKESIDWLNTIAENRIDASSEIVKKLLQ